MNDAYYTQTGERPDLAALEVNPPEGFIGAEIMPVVPVADKSGTIYYATLTADAAGQTGRSAGVAPTGTQISDSSTTFTAAEVVKRGQITPDEAKQMGGIEKADMVGSKWAKRQTMRAIESAVAAIVAGGTADYTFDSAKVLEQVQTALDALRLYEGITALVTATSTFKRMVQGILSDSTYGVILGRTITGTAPNVAVSGMSLQAWKDAIAMLFGVDEIKLGDSGIWDDSTTSTDEKFAIMKLDATQDPLSHKWMPVFGKTYQFMPDGVNPWVVQSVADRVNVNNLYDAYCWYNCVELNSGAMKLFGGIG